MPTTLIYMVIIEKPPLHKQNIIGGGRLIEFSINWILQDIIQVRLICLGKFRRQFCTIFILSSGLVLFLEEDHYVAEDFLYLLELMQKRSLELCPKCNILSLGTYLKTFNYYTYNSKVFGKL